MTRRDKIKSGSSGVTVRIISPESRKSESELSKLIAEHHVILMEIQRTERTFGTVIGTRPIETYETLRKRVIPRAGRGEGQCETRPGSCIHDPRWIDVSKREHDLENELGIRKP